MSATLENCKELYALMHDNWKTDAWLWDIQDDGGHHWSGIDRTGEYEHYQPKEGETFIRVPAYDATFVLDKLPAFIVNRSHSLKMTKKHNSPSKGGDAYHFYYNDSQLLNPKVVGIEAPTIDDAAVLLAVEVIKTRGYV